MEVLLWLDYVHTLYGGDDILEIANLYMFVVYGTYIIVLGFNGDGFLYSLFLMFKLTFYKLGAIFFCTA